MNINWYPGHMVKAFNKIKENLKLIDVVVYILDARIPVSSQNPELDNIIEGKKKIIVLNKTDLADITQTKLWVQHFKNRNIIAIPVQSNTGLGINEVIRKIEEIMTDEIVKRQQKGRIGKIIRMLVVGVPNVGKSSFINRISKRTSAKVGNKPGITKQNQWVRVNEKIELLDTPGVLWPKFEDDEIALHLSYTGTIKDEVLQMTEVAMNLIQDLLDKYPTLLMKRYKLDENDVKESTDKLLEIIAKKRGAILSGNRIDYEKISDIILNDFRVGKIGTITLERVNQDATK